jgi:hypothetical protein
MQLVGWEQRFEEYYIKGRERGWFGSHLSSESADGSSRLSLSVEAPCSRCIGWRFVLLWTWRLSWEVLVVCKRAAREKRDWACCFLSPLTLFRLVASRHSDCVLLERSAGAQQCWERWFFVCARGQ